MTSRLSQLMPRRDRVKGVIHLRQKEKYDNMYKMGVCAK